MDYPLISDRVKAYLIDSVVIVGLMFVAFYAISLFGSASPWVRGALLILVLSYEPLTTSAMGGTLGHWMLDLRVKRAREPGKNLFVWTAFFRYLLKLLLGVVSLFVVMFNDRGRTIHDLACGSIVLYSEE